MATFSDEDDNDKWMADNKAVPAVAPTPMEPAGPTVAEKKPAPPPGLVLDDLKEGMHVRLKCKCEGFIKSVTNSDYREERWFSFLPTKNGCLSGSTAKNLEVHYSEHSAEGAAETYHPDSFSGVLPAFECPAPDWFPTVNSTPRSSNDKRAIRIRVCEGYDIIIPGCLMNQKVFTMANLLREVAPKIWEVEVIEVQSGISADTMKPAIALLEKFQKSPSKTPKERNVEVLYNWILSTLHAMPRGMSISIPGTSAVDRDKIKEVLAMIAKHPLWDGNTIEVNSNEGYLVTLGSDGTVK